MLALARPELIIFTFVMMGYLAGAVVGVLQVLAGGERYRRFLQPVVCLSVCGGCGARAYAATGNYMGEEPFCAYIPPEAAR